MRAIVRPPGAALADCALTFLERRPIDVERAREQHAGYRAALAAAGLAVETLATEDDQPDATFVEDAAVVLDEIAILTRPAAAARRAEVESVARALGAYREVHAIAAPATLEGGDVLRLGRRLYVGLSTRTDAAGARALAALVEPLGYDVRPVGVAGCLHLKSAVTALDDETVLLNPDWVEVAALAGLERVEVAPDEPFAGCALALPGTLLVSASWPRTREALAREGFPSRAVAIDELEKAEAGLTCLSLLLA